MTKTRIVLADDHPIVLDGLRNLVGAEADFELVGEAGGGLAALKVIREKRPDVAVLDISMPEMNGIVLSRRLIAEMPDLHILVLTLRAVVVGGTYVDPAIVGRVFDGKHAAKPSASKGAAPALTEREGAVLKMAALGFTNKAIASRLDVGVKSVETYKARGLEKLGLRTRAELVRYASGQGWLEI
jgi:DNA-binding NarL/FixJ family response regulator